MTPVAGAGHGGVEPVSVQSIHPPGRAPDRVALALLSADRPQGPGATALLAHLRTCRECIRVLDALAAVDRALAALPPTPMPAVVAERITAALAAAPPVVAEHPAGAAHDTSAAAGRAHAVTSARSGRTRRSRRLQVLGAVAAGLVVLGGAGYLLADTGASPAGMSSAGGTGAPEGTADDSGTGSLPHYDRQSLREAVGALLAQPGQPGVAAPQAVPYGSSLQVDPACLPAHGPQVLSATRAVYDGRSAVVLLVAAADPRQVQVRVLLADCPAAATAAVLDEFTADR